MGSFDGQKNIKLTNTRSNDYQIVSRQACVSKKFVARPLVEINKLVKKDDNE